MQWFNEFKSLMLYGGTDKEHYTIARTKIEHQNRRMALTFSSFATFFIFVMYILSYILEGFASSRQVYTVGMVASLVLVCMALSAKKNPLFTYVLIYSATALFYIYGIALAIFTRPEEQTVTFMVMLIFVPLIFVDRPIRMASNIIFFDIVFMVLASIYKQEPVRSVDITDAIVFGILSVVAIAVVYGVKIRNCVFENELHAFSETDQLTGLNNRNCYEWKLKTYPTMYAKSICCIYIDVNGLHEMNNTKGHKAGDEMLCYIANALRNEFGDRNAYRIGGDEYIVFVLDMDKKTVLYKIDEIKKAVEAEGYHVAIGQEYYEHKYADMDKLISMAEMRMYKDKSEFYKDDEKRSVRIDFKDMCEIMIDDDNDDYGG